MSTITPQVIIDRICQSFSDVKPKTSWGETSLFYNPNNQLPNGIYFCTLKEKDGANDQASKLNREGVYRLAIGLPKNTYQELFGSKPARPTKGKSVALDYDFSELNTLMPHPVYAWMSWAQILSPTKEMFEKTTPYIEQAHHEAIIKFVKKIPNNQ